MAIDGLLASIRVAALDPDAWRRVHRLSERYFGAVASQMASVDHGDGNRFFSRTTRVPEIDAHIREIARISEPVRFTARRPRWRRFVDCDYIDEASIARSDVCRNCARFDIGYVWPMSPSTPVVRPGPINFGSTKTTVMDGRMWTTKF